MKLTEVAKIAKAEDPAEGAYSVIDEAVGEAPMTVPNPGDDATGEGSVAVPDVAGLPMRRAVQAVLEAGLEPIIDGSGRVERTEPPLGSRVPKGSKLVIVFEPQT